MMLFESLPVVVSASRVTQQLNELSVPVSVISAQDIQYSGATTIADLLDFVPGVDVLQLDRNRYAIGVRGLHELYSERTLTMIDGRAADSVTFGGSEFLRLPVLLHDIDRIEVVRGPGGASWGANAFNGVINIIMKEPEELQGVMGAATLNEFGDVYSQARWGDSRGDWRWRISFGYQTRESSEDALSGETFQSRDFSRDFRTDSELIHEISDMSKLTLGLGFSNRKEGDFELGGFFPQRDSQLSTVRAFARLDHEFASGVSMYLQWFGHFSDTEQASAQNTETSENDLETQFSFNMGESHELVVGGNVRRISLASNSQDVQLAQFAGGGDVEAGAGLFVLDRWTAQDRLILEIQARGDYYSETHSDWSSRLTALYSLADDDSRVFRLSGARAFRAPLIALRATELQRLVGPLAVPTLLAPQSELDNEGIWSLEIGYTAIISEKLSFRADGYFQRYSDLIGFSSIVVQTAFGPFPAGTPSNIDGATAFGGEVELAWKLKLGQVAIWYAYNDFEIDFVGQDVRAFLPAQHKTGITSRIFLPGDWVLNAKYKYSDRTLGRAVQIGNAASYNRVDLTLAKGISDGRAEILIGVQDLFDETEMAIGGLGNLTSHETPGRVALVQLMVSF